MDVGVSLLVGESKSCSNSLRCLFSHSVQESHEIIVSGLKSIWPNLPLQSEENDRAIIKVEPIPETLNMEIQELVQKGDRDIPLGEFVCLAITHICFDLLYMTKNN